MGPAVYYISNPIGAMLAVYLVCASVVYCLVPAANKAGIKLNPKANRQKATQKAVVKLERVMQPLLPGLGLTWSDIEDCFLWIYCFDGFHDAFMQTYVNASHR